MSNISPRVVMALCAVSVLVSLGALSLTVAIIAAPHYWFADAFAAKGPTGDPGPRGPVGPSGPEGPVGPDAQSSIDDLSTQVDDLSSSLSDLETGSGDQASVSVDDLAAKVDDLETGAGDQASMSVDDLASTVTGLCDVIAADNLYDITEAFGSFINDLYGACP